MNRVIPISLLLGGTLLCATPADAQPPAGEVASARSIAEAWLEAYGSQDFDRMTSLMTDETVFIDPTSFAIDAVTNRIEWQGPAAITSGIAGWGMTQGVYTIDRTYEASGHVVFNGHVDVIYGEGEERQAFRYPITTIISVINGRVAEHRDYTDFHGASRVEPSH